LERTSGAEALRLCIFTAGLKACSTPYREKSEHKAEGSFVFQRIP